MGRARGGFASKPILFTVTTYYIFCRGDSRIALAGHFTDSPGHAAQSLDPTARAIRESPLRFSAKNTQNGSRFARIPLSAEMSGLSPTSLTLAQADRLVR